MIDTLREENETFGNDGNFSPAKCKDFFANSETDILEREKIKTETNCY